MPQDHFCPWREEAEELKAEVGRIGTQVQSLQTQLTALQRHVFGKKAEKLPSVTRQLRQDAGSAEDEAARTAAALRKRRERAASKAEGALTREVRHPVPLEARHCPACGSEDLKPLGEGRRTVTYEYVPAFFERQVHVQEVLACACGQGVVTAPAPARVVDRGEYGPGFLAHVVTSKCADAMPLHRLAQRIERGGVPTHRSTLTDLFHQAASVLLPLSTHLLQVIAASEVVWADETPVRVLDVKKTKQGYLWTFLTQTQQGEWLLGYRFSLSRAGKTPKDVLGGTRGALVVDAYTGYNAVTLPEGRVRVGCWAHVRRRFFDALPTAPEAREALDFILALYRVEALARDAGVVRTDAHHELRQQQSLPVLMALRAWMDSQATRHLPKGPMGQALSYALKQWEALTRFTSDARLPLDNNRSEAALRKAALGRKNFLFVGHQAAGENLAGLYALVATCEANSVNPETYLADVLLRVQTHPNARIGELLPHEWKRLRATDSS
ncbi:IS66 family transposase [Corallococcus interemptor]|uniref:IS66 family transposase n=1 Tax=Corallococcus interemptor TaxID=2316720 RepID=A0A3A8PTT2_9BACT|nr:IS66 family transposase [Corallococcus interemptor]RKH59689.1 IS66 family transposase [Corallococcus interemptor]